MRSYGVEDILPKMFLYMKMKTFIDSSSIAGQPHRVQHTELSIAPGKLEKTPKSF